MEEKQELNMYICSLEMQLKGARARIEELEQELAAVRKMNDTFYRGRIRHETHPSEVSQSRKKRS